MIIFLLQSVVLCLLRHIGLISRSTRSSFHAQTFIKIYVTSSKQTKFSETWEGQHCGSYFDQIIKIRSKSPHGQRHDGTNQTSHLLISTTTTTKFILIIASCLFFSNSMGLALSKGLIFGLLPFPHYFPFPHLYNYLECGNFEFLNLTVFFQFNP